MEPTDKFVSKMDVEMNKMDIEQPSGHMVPQANGEGEPYSPEEGQNPLGND